MVASLEDMRMTGLGGQEEATTALVHCAAVGVSAVQKQDAEIAVQSTLRAHLD